ncbi:hypothetical protein COCNU_scaffold001035G000010 [Cocos nucifera]|nr:hypothetical protein [Cocos nucifera]
MTTNRFICEVCNKGFQREQNLQLHRRGHNLPWKLRQKSTKEVRRRVYVCPEPTCVHHDPSRALGDLTGIKKHFYRKHGEKKWKCEKCSKRYAVQSDWKAHSKTCGTREYRCGCGTLFSRRDSFITHRGFCDALAQEGKFMSDHMGGSISSLFGTSMQNESFLPQMSATALLQKAARIGSTTSGGSSLLQGFSSSSSSAAKRTDFQASISGGSNGGGDGLRSQLENETRLQDLMYSLANGNASISADSSGIAAFGGRCTTGGHEQQSGGFGGLDSGLCNMDEAKFHLNLSAGSVVGSDQLTRDFLGVGDMVKSMTGGVSQRE